MSLDSHKGERTMKTIRTSEKASMKNVRRLYLCLSVFICGSISLLAPAPASAQDWFRTGTGLGVSKARVAVADFAGKSPSAQPLRGIQRRCALGPRVQRNS